MPENYSRLLAISVKQAREAIGWTQEQLAEYSNMDVRTIINIEKGRGNPKLEKLFPLVRTLRIDARTLFDDGISNDSPSLPYLKSVLDDCSPDELITIRPVIEAVLAALRTKHPLDID